jgi:hypothetical protein
MYKVQPMCENVVIADLPTSMYKVQSFYESIGEVCLLVLLSRMSVFIHKAFFYYTLKSNH